MLRSYYWFLLPVLLGLGACSTAREVASRQQAPPVPAKVSIQLRNPGHNSLSPLQLTTSGMAVRKYAAADADSTRPFVTDTRNPAYHTDTIAVWPLPVDLYASTPYELAQMLLRQMRRAARQSREMRGFVKYDNPEWKPLLLPQRNLLARKFTTGRRLARANFLATMQWRIQLLLDSARLASTPPLCNLPSARYQLTPQNSAPAAVAGAAAQQVIFSEQKILPLTPTQRILDVTITDKGESALLRYYVCARYSIITPTKSYVSVLPTDSDCPPQPGYVTITVPFAQLDRAIFVEKMLMALQPGSLVENTPANQQLRKSLETAISNSLKLQQRSAGLSDSVIFYTAQAKVLGQQKADLDSQLKQDSTRTPQFYKEPLAGLQTQAAALAKQQDTNQRLLDAQTKKVSSLTPKKNTNPSAAAKSALADARKQLKQLQDSLKQLKLQQDSLKQPISLRTKQAELVNELKHENALLKNASTNQTSAGLQLKQAQDSVQKRTNRLSNAAAAVIKQVADAKAKQAAAAVDVVAASADTDVLAVEPEKNTNPTSALRNALTDIYLDLIRQQTQYLDAPQAGVVDVLEGGNVYVPNVTRPQWCFQLDVTEIEVEDGVVLGLKATGRNASTGQLVVFESRAPIGISSDRDLYNEWQHQRLWLQYPLFGSSPHQPAYVRLTDVLRYYPRLAAQAGDRSPADQVYLMHPNDPLSLRTVSKMPTQKILQGRIYTDLEGVRSENPNGLVQLEVDRRFNFGAPWSKFSPNFQLQAFGYFTPFISINKLEQQNRYLPLERTEQRGIYRVQTIDLLRYTNFRVGGDYNLLGLRLPRFKSDFALDFNFGLHRVDIRDTLTRVNRPTPVAPKVPVRIDTTVNVGMYGLSLKTRIRPDSRYGITARLGYYRYVLLNSRDDQLFIDQRPDVTSHEGSGTFEQLVRRYWFQGVIQYELTGRLKISENAEYFIRPQLSHLLYNSYRTYFQIQTGFQFNIFGPRRETPPGPNSPWSNPRIGGLQPARTP